MKLTRAEAADARQQQVQAAQDARWVLELAVFHPTFSISRPCCRYKRLLQESREWVSREELVERINHALDNPSPFGFDTSIPKFTGY
jgi:hypothetical protein